MEKWSKVEYAAVRFSNINIQICNTQLMFLPELCILHDWAKHVTFILYLIYAKDNAFIVKRLNRSVLLYSRSLHIEHQYPLCQLLQNFYLAST